MTSKKQTKKIIVLTFISFCAFALSSCTTFGVSNDQWNKLTPDQKQIVMNNYYAQQRQQQADQARVDQINAQNAPLTDAISALASALPQHTNTSSQSNTQATSQCNPSQTDCSYHSKTTGSSTSISF